MSFWTSHHTMSTRVDLKTIRVNLNWKIVIGPVKHSGCNLKDENIDKKLVEYWDDVKKSIKRSIQEPKHSKLVDSLYLFDKPKEYDVHPLDMSKTFRETFGSHDMSKQLELYTDYYNPNSSGNSSGRTGKRKRED